jgi:hypothetical protein
MRVKSSNPRTWELYLLGDARKQRVRGCVQGGQLYH